jgi:hypothetical protein
MESDFKDILIVNEGTGVGLNMQHNTAISLNAVNFFTVDESILIDGNSFLNTYNCGVSSANKDGLKLTNGAFVYSSSTIFYGNAPTYYDVSVDATSTFEFTADNAFYNNTTEFLGTITRTSSGSMIANDSSVTGVTVKDTLNTLSSEIGGAIVEIVDPFTATAGQTIFTLSNTPSINCKTEVAINGLEMTYGATYDYTLSANIITFNYGLDLDDIVTVSYF